MGKTPETLDDSGVPDRGAVVGRTVRFGLQLFEQAQRLVLAGERFIVFERQIRERAVMGGGQWWRSAPLAITCCAARRAF